MSNIVNNLVEDYIRTTLKEKDGLLGELEEYANEHNVPIVHKEVSELLKVLLKIQKPKKNIRSRMCYRILFYTFCICIR